MACMVSYAEMAAERSKNRREAIGKRKAAAEHRERKEKARTLSQWLNWAQVPFNAWIRWRDRDDGCISCGTHSGQMHAGHFISVGAGRAALRYDERNVNKQCSQCNNNKGGNSVEYRKGMVRKYGEDVTREIESYHAPVKMTVEEIKALHAKYSARLRDEKKGG